MRNTSGSATLQKSNPVEGVLQFLMDYIILLPIILLVVVWSAIAPNFMTYNNWMNIFRQISMVAILAAGMFFVMLTGNIDMGLASVVGICSCIFSKLMVDAGMSPVISGLLTALLGISCGLISGVLHTRFGIPAFIATLGMQYAARGMCYVVTNSYPITGIPASIGWIGRGYLKFGETDIIPWPVVFMLIVFIVVAFIASKTKFGRFVYSVGGNAEAAYLSGINDKAIKTYVFMIAGFAAALVSIILTSRLSSGQPIAGTGWEFKAVIACVMGGVSLSGGKGKPVGVALGAVFVGILENGMTLLNISSYVQQVVQGVVLVAAIAFDVYKTRRQAASK